MSVLTPLSTTNIGYPYTNHPHLSCHHPHLSCHHPPSPLSPPPSPLSPQTTRHLLSLHIAQTERLLQDLRAAYNVLPPSFASLPPELLGKVFGTLAEDAFGAFVERWEKGEGGEGAYAWIGVTRVCKSWRSAALGCSSLWRRLVLSSATSASPLHLSLSKTRPLSILLSSPSPTLATHAPRTQTLRLSLAHRSQGVEDLLAETLTRAPILDALKITMRDPWRSMRLPTPTPDSESLCIPSLRHLSLTKCHVLPSSPLFAQTLTTLELRSLDPDTRFTLGGFLVLLARLPSLERLSISDIFEEDRHDDHVLSPSPPQTPIRLPHLTSFLIHSCPCTIPPLLSPSHLSLPSLSTLHTTCPSCPSTNHPPHHLSSASSALRTYLLNRLSSAPREPDSLEVDCGAGSVRARVSWGDEPERGRGRRRLSVSFVPPFSHLPEAPFDPASFLTGLPLSTVRTLRLHLPPRAPVPAPAFLSTLAAEAVELVGTPAPDVVTALLTGTLKSPEPRGLRTLLVRSANQRWEKQIAFLCEVLRSQYRDLEEVVVENCTTEEGRLEAIREAVGRVVWDGVREREGEGEEWGGEEEGWEGWRG